MKKLILALSVIMLSTLCHAQRMEIVNGDTVLYLTDDNACNLQKVARLVTVYNRYQNTRKKNKEKLWIDTKNVIESTCTASKNNIRMNRRNFIVLFYYRRIVYRYQLVNRRPASYKKFWAGWYCRYMSRLLPYYKTM
ncbi:MAG: hypothetical protein P4L28_12075 [Paludibacteraceae bacterium]|nr:hypothetical protein [Paludibacteraceae bacterium]